MITLLLPAPRTHARLVAVSSNDPDHGRVHHARPQPVKARRLFAAFMFSKAGRQCHGNIAITIYGAVNEVTLEDIRDYIREHNRISRRVHVSILGWNFLESEVPA